MRTSSRVRWRRSSSFPSRWTLWARPSARCRSPTRTTPGTDSAHSVRCSADGSALALGLMLCLLSSAVCGFWGGWWRRNFSTERSGRREEPTGAGPGWVAASSPSTRTGELWLYLLMPSLISMWRLEVDIDVSAVSQGPDPGADLVRVP